jgi:superfamily II DNA/RNA helicase
MVTKGLDFENVTLVGVINADQSLYTGDYRASERCFSLITQVIGRSGRGSKTGRALIQTFTPHNQVLHLAAAEGIVYEDNTDPDQEKPVTVEGLEGVLQAKTEKETNSIGFDFYATTVTVNDQLQIVKIHQDYDVAQ